MREITIIGAGQSGLMVALGLIQKDYKVNLVSNRTAEQIRNGRILSSQGMMQPAIQAERDLGLRFWEIVLSAAEHNTKIADHVFNGFNDAALYEPWFYDAQAAEELVASMSEKLI
jgi:2-polyprenyl-6-methoxyphenol hydroxylase-like FAD-dependent oxidoreductase